MVADRIIERTCLKCGHAGPREEFVVSKRHRFGRKNECKPCFNVRHRTAQQGMRNRRREIVAAAKDRPCADCGVSYPAYVMDFDHVRGVKIGAVGGNAIGANWPEARILAEIAKCDVVCANCHRERTHGQARALSAC